MITSTIAQATAKAILIDIDNIKSYRDKVTNELLSIGAYEKEFTLFGDFSLDGFAKAIRKDIEKNYINVCFVGINKKSFDKQEVKMELDDDKFLELAHVVQEKESKLNLITRTLKSVSVPYVAVNKSREFIDCIYKGKALDDAKIKKAIEKECAEKGLMLFDIGKGTTTETLYGLDKREFIKAGKLATDKGGKA